MGSPYEGLGKVFPLEVQLAIWGANLSYSAVSQVVEGMTLAQAKLEVEEKPLEPAYGSTLYPEIEGEVKRLLPKVQEQARDMDIVLKLLYSPEKVGELPEHIWRRVDAIFDAVPQPAKLKAWNREQVKKGRYGHILAYLLQDFRNSEIAEQLASIYGKLSKEGRVAFEKALRDGIGDDFRFELLCKVGMKPYVIPPEQSPVYTTKEVRVKGIKEKWVVVTNSAGKQIYTGIDQAPPQLGSWEGNNVHCYDSKGRKLFIGDYYVNSQPNFRFYQHGTKEGDTREHFFKTYLGAKGSMLYYSETVEKEGETSVTDSTSVSLSREQLLALRRFFRWERGKKDDENIRQHEINYDMFELIDEINKVMRGLDVSPAPISEDAVNRHPNAKAVLLKLKKYLTALPGKDQEKVQKFITNYTITDKHSNEFKITKGSGGDFVLKLTKKAKKR